jgi:LPXTG-motif cell wall-anchored protein
MKLLTKRLLAVAMVIAMTLGMAISAMAIKNIDDAKLKDVGLDPAKSEIVYGWINIEDASDADGASDQADTEYVTANGDGTYTIDFSAHASSKYSKFAMVHNYAGNGQEIVAGTSITVDSLSPFCLVGQKKDGSDVSGDDDDDSSSSSSHKSSKSSSSGKKSPKTGMNDSWMLWLMAAGVFAGASVVTYNRKKG